ncbi:Palmitoyltransferase ZDHHC17 [Hypsibius exemplaris]|uniref:Palmitoyltransferase n=1 Tax=Hypsibius exemplaris TaxID=2072580 RepID=A0A1W0WQJ6_HYPEX|nr:Palmitoyltransferase ZDHHC17 [Hypsibius exemplaris]
MEEPPVSSFGDASQPFPNHTVYPSYSSNVPSTASAVADPAKEVLSPYLPPAELSAALVDASQRGNLERLKQLVEAYDYDVNTPDREDCSLLQWAALNNHVQCIQFLVDRGANVNYTGGELRATPMHWATFMGNLAAVVCLVKNGADATVVNRDGCGTLHFACQRGFSHIVAFLLGKGLDVNLRDQFGMTPLMWSTKVSAVDPARLLINMGADVNLKDRMHGNTALHWAALNTNISVCQLLLKHGADVDALNAEGKTPLAISLTDKRNRYIEDVLRKHRQEKGLEGSWLTRNVARNDDLIKVLFNMIPFVTFIFIGLTMTLAWSVLWKILFIVLYCVGTFYVGKWLNFFRFADRFPLAVYIGCKTCVIATVCFIWIPSIVSFWSITWWLLLLSGLMYTFGRTWLGDPGFISPPKEDKLQAVVELAEKNEFNVVKLCTSCMVVKPLRSKHCSICGKCVDRMDHHCPFTGNCVGKKNHRFFVGYLIFLSLAGVYTIWAGCTYVGMACGLSSQHFLLTIGPSLHGCPWSMYVIIFSLGFTAWVMGMAVMQIHQISVMAMTTNERINQRRYGHFRDEDGTDVNPFNKGFVGNCLEFFECDANVFKRLFSRRGAAYTPLKTSLV